MWALRVIGLASLGGVLWHRHGAVAEWAVWGALACAALGASWLERRRAGWFTCLVSLTADYSLATALFWAMGGADWRYWVFVIPLLHALWRWGARGAWLSAPFLVSAIGAGWFWQTGELLVSDPQPLSWAVGLAALSVALGWMGRVREPSDYAPLIQQAEIALAESEAAERRIRERYRELTHHYRRLEEQLELLQDEADMWQALQRARDPDAIHRALLDRVRARFGASGAALYLLDETGVHIQAVSALGALAHLAGTAVRTPHQPFQRTPEPAQVIEQLRRATLTATDLTKAQTPPERRAPALVLPLLTEGRLLGALALTTNAPEGFSDETRTRLRNLLPHLAALLALTEQIRLMSVRLAETQFLYDMENLLFRADTAQSLPQRALNLLRTVLPHEHAQLVLKRDQQLEIAAQVGDLPDLRAYLGERSAWTQAQIVSPDSSQAFAPAQSLLIVPLRGGVRTEGALLLGRSHTPPFSPADLELIQPLTVQLTTVLERAQLLSDLERLATTDGLTGVYNYRHFQERYREAINQSLRYQHPLAIMLIDLDNFKQVNDAHGHLEGDYLLVQFAEMLQNALRNTECVARYGGDEFVVLMHATNLQGALTAGKRVLHTVRKTPFLDTMGQARLKISISIGVAAYPNSTENPAEVLEKADEALEIAKRNGRNQVVAFENTA